MKIFFFFSITAKSINHRKHYNKTVVSPCQKQLCPSPVNGDKYSLLHLGWCDLALNCWLIILYDTKGRKKKAVTVLDHFFFVWRLQTVLCGRASERVSLAPVLHQSGCQLLLLDTFDIQSEWLWSLSSTAALFLQVVLTSRLALMMFQGSVFLRK